MISQNQLLGALAFLLWTLYLWNRKDIKGVSIKSTLIDRESRKRDQALIALLIENAAPNNEQISHLAKLVREL